MATSNLRFVVKIARHYGGYGFRLADLVEEGNVGLLEAVRRFEPARKLRFMTYASYWVRAYILAHVLKQWSLVGVGTGPLQSRLFFRLGRERARISTALGLESSDERVDEQLAIKLGTTTDRVRDMSARLAARDASLDVAAFRDSDVSRLDLLPDEHEGQEAQCARSERDALVRRALDAVAPSMTARDRYIIEHRLMSDESETLAEIAEHLHLSRERVRQLELRVKSKLRRALVGVGAQA